MTTASTIIRQSLSRLAVRAAGEAVSGDDAADALQALNILYVLVATGAAKRDDRYQDTRLHFNIHPR